MGGDWQETARDIATSRWTTAALILIAVLLAFSFRLYPATLPITDDWAQQTVQNQVVSQYEQELRQQFPTLPRQQLRQRATQEYQEYRAQNKEQLEAQEKRLSEQFKSRLQLTLEKDSGGTYEQTYFLAIDPYHYLRRAENILEDGDVCDKIEDGECIDDHMRAPTGVATSGTGHDYIQAGFGKAATWFGYAPMTGIFYLPAILMALAVIPAFLVARRRYGTLAGFTAAVIVGLHASLLGRTPAGFADTDAWNALFPLTVIALLLYGLDTKDTYKRWSLIGAAGLLAGTYSWFWAGWYFTFFVLLLVLIATAGFHLLKALLAKKRDYADAKDAGILAGIYLLGAGITTSIFKSPSTFINALTAPLGISVGIQNPINQDLWPNVLTTVAELNTTTLPQIINSMGGKLLFLIAIIGAFTYSFKSDEMDARDWSLFGGLVAYYALLLTSNALALGTFSWLALFALPMVGLLIYDLYTGAHGPIHYGIWAIGWLVASVFATTQGTRFSLLILPAFAINIAFFIGWLLRALPPVLDTHIEVPRFYGKAFVVVLVALLLFTPVAGNYVSNAHDISKNEVPSMNDAWWEALTTIKEDSQPDAIITSWWDFGHWFKYVADRPVTFDGASQVPPNAHWVGHLLQTDDYTESIDILRMLNCGQNGAYEEIFEREQDTLEAYRITDRIIGVNEQEARSILEEENFTEEEIRQILEKSHCEPPESYLIVSEDMVGKAGVWAHFGLWDFERAYAYREYQNHGRQQAIQNIQDKLNMSRGEATQTYTEIAQLGSRQQANRWISPYPGYAGQRSCQRSNETITCRLGLRISEQQGVPIIADTLTVPTADVQSSTINLVAQGQEVGEIMPRAVSIDGEHHEIGGEFSLGIRITGNQALLAQEEVVDSTFTQLFYDEEPGPYLERVTKTNQVTGGKIIVYKVDWEEYLADGN